MTASPGQHEAAGIEAVLERHSDWWEIRRHEYACDCGEEYGAPADKDAVHRAHVAAALREHLSSVAVVEAATDEAALVFGWQHLARYSGQSGEWLRLTLGAVAAAALAAALSAPPAPSKAVDE